MSMALARQTTGCITAVSETIERRFTFMELGSMAKFGVTALPERR